MEKIRKSEVKEEIRKIQKILEGHKNMSQRVQKKLEQMGYSFEYLGTGQSAETWSCFVEVKNIKSKRYLNGKFLVVGMSHLAHGKGKIYRGYVKEIIEG